MRNEVMAEQQKLSFQSCEELGERRREREREPKARRIKLYFFNWLSAGKKFIPHFSGRERKRRKENCSDQTYHK
jgi:hypothetical protein